jgi:DnaA family protein
VKQLALDIAPAPPPEFGNFVPGRNAEAVAALRALAAGEGGERIVYLWGEAGSGRSHLLAATAAAARLRGRDALVTGAGALPAYEAVEAGALAIVDDVEMLDDPAQVALFNLLNAARAGRGAVVAAGAGAPRSLALRPDVVTRLASGLVYQVHGLTDTEKAEALRRHAAGRGFRLADEVIAYLLSHARRDLPSLMMLLEALDRHSLEAKRPVTVALVRELLQTAAPR